MGVTKAKTTVTEPADGLIEGWSELAVLAMAVIVGLVLAWWAFRVEPKKRKTGERKKVQKTLMQYEPEQVKESILDAISLNPDAEPFHPGKSAAYEQVGGEVQKSSQGTPLIAHAPISKRIKDQPTSDVNDPDWMQYLSKKFETPPKTTAAPVQVKSPGLGRLHVAKATNVPSPTPGGIRILQSQAGEAENKATSSANVIRTSEYLQMLKGSKSINSGISEQASRKAEKPQLPLGVASHGVGQTQTGSSSLAQMWLTAFKKNPQLDDEIAEEGEQVQQFVPQDDILVERLTADRDISEELYWSDCDSTTYQKTRRIEDKSKLKPAAAHLLSAKVSHQAPNTKLPGYVMQDLSSELDRTTAMLLLRLQRFTDQRRILHFKEGNGRRFIIGLKEVFRRTRQHAVKCLVIAPDIDEASESGGIDERVREILAFAYQNDIAVMFALSRAGLGRALGKTLNISIVGLVDVTGCRDLFDKAMDLSSAARLAWLQRVEGEALPIAGHSTAVSEELSVPPDADCKGVAKVSRGNEKRSGNGTKPQKDQQQQRYEKYDYNGYTQDSGTGNYYGNGYGNSHKSGYNSYNNNGYRGSYSYENQGDDSSYGYGGGGKWHKQWKGGGGNSWYGRA